MCAARARCTGDAAPAVAVLRVVLLARTKLACAWLGLGLAKAAAAAAAAALVGDVSALR